nr:hypothetical protein Iba_chr10aCG2620 [Ipomoea batatas]
MSKKLSIPIIDGWKRPSGPAGKRSITNGNHLSIRQLIGSSPQTSWVFDVSTLVIVKSNVWKLLLHNLSQFSRSADSGEMPRVNPFSRIIHERYSVRRSRLPIQTQDCMWKGITSIKQTTRLFKAHRKLRRSLSRTNHFGINGKALPDSNIQGQRALKKVLKHDLCHLLKRLALVRRSFLSRYSEFKPLFDLSLIHPTYKHPSWPMPTITPVMTRASNQCYGKTALRGINLSSNYPSR